MLHKFGVKISQGNLFIYIFQQAHQFIYFSARLHCIVCMHSVQFEREEHMDPKEEEIQGRPTRQQQQQQTTPTVQLPIILSRINRLQRG